MLACGEGVHHKTQPTGGPLGRWGSGWTVPGCLDVEAAGTPVPELGGKPCMDRLEGARCPELHGTGRSRQGRGCTRPSPGDLMGGR